MACEKKQDAHVWSRDRSSLGGSPELQKDNGKHNSQSQNLNLAKLNPNCHMNYSNYL